MTDATELRAALEKLATRQDGYGMVYDARGLAGAAEIHLYGDRAVAAHWLMEHGLAALHPPAAESGEGQSEVDRLMHVIDRDRYVAAIVYGNLKTLFSGYDWLRGPARGSFAYDDERYQLEFGLALDAFEASIAPLAKLARDKTDCTTDPDKVQAARDAARAHPALATPTPAIDTPGIESGEK